MSGLLRVPCAYQGGKQRVAAQIVDVLLEAVPAANRRFYDLCCGSGAISIELVNRGVDPSHIVMLDISSWGMFWSAIGEGTFDMEVFDRFLAGLPEDKRDFKRHMSALSSLPIGGHEAELYPVLQACSFGGKQIWRDGQRWANACFRDHWEPTANSVRRSPANPMQPAPTELRRRIGQIVHGMKGVKCIKKDIREVLNHGFDENSVIYIDPPYKGTTGYAYRFDVQSLIGDLQSASNTPIFVSEGVPLNREALLLKVAGAKGGISGNRKGRHEEWLTQFKGSQSA